MKQAQYNAARNLAAKTIQRAYRSKKAPLTQTQAKAVAKIAKKTTMTQVETKLGFQVQETRAITERSFLSYNLVNQMGFSNAGSQTGEAGRVVGDQIKLKGYRVRGLLGQMLSNLDRPATYTMALIKTPVYKTITNLSDADLLPSYGGTDAIPRFDKTKCTVLKKWTTTVHNSGDVGQPSQKPFDFYVDLKDQTFKFKDLTADWQSKNYNIYFVIWCSTIGSVKGTINAGRIEFTHELYYKDA